MDNNSNILEIRNLKKSFAGDDFSIDIPEFSVPVGFDRWNDR